jgi:hypothetical protein
MAERREFELEVAFRGESLQVSPRIHAYFRHFCRRRYFPVVRQNFAILRVPFVPLNCPIKPAPPAEISDFPEVIPQRKSSLDSSAKQSGNGHIPRGEFPHEKQSGPVKMDQPTES